MQMNTNRNGFDSDAEVDGSSSDVFKEKCQGNKIF